MTALRSIRNDLHNANFQLNLGNFRSGGDLAKAYHELILGNAGFSGVLGQHVDVVNDIRTMITGQAQAVQQGDATVGQNIAKQGGK